MRLDAHPDTLVISWENFRERLRTPDFEQEQQPPTNPTSFGGIDNIAQSIAQFYFGIWKILDHPFL
jgi:hypothetical protein